VSARGFTLLEVLVALLVLGTSAFGTALLIVATLASGGAAQVQFAATRLLADAHELASIDLLDVAAVGRWQADARMRLPAPSDPASTASVTPDPADVSGRTRFVALRWAEPGSGGDRDSLLQEVRSDWLPP